MASLQEGTVFAGRYRIVRCIAAGGMGEVHEVIHLETDRRRALKVMHAHTLQSDDLRERFKREAKVAAHIESEFIVDVFDAGVDEATQMPFLVMELLRGEELSKLLKRVGRFPPADVVRFLQQTARALEKTHAASIVHRDLKPENLFLVEREEGPGTIKVLDFGIAKIVAEGLTSSATQTVGTPIYMAPEQFRPDVKITSAVDIFALGMVAFTLLVGSPYWDAEQRAGIYALTAAAIFGPQEPASARAGARGVALPPMFDAWFARATAASPEHRFASAKEAVRALAQALGVALAGRASLPSISEVSDLDAFYGRDSYASFEGAPPSSSAPGSRRPASAPGFSSANAYPASYPTPSGPGSAPGTPPGFGPPPSYSSGALGTGVTPPPSSRPFMQAGGHTPAPGAIHSPPSSPTHPTALGASITGAAPAPQAKSRTPLGAVIAAAFALTLVGGAALVVLVSGRGEGATTDQTVGSTAQGKSTSEPSGALPPTSAAAPLEPPAPAPTGAPTASPSAEPVAEPVAPSPSASAPQSNEPSGGGEAPGAAKPPTRTVSPLRKKYPRD